MSKTAIYIQAGNTVDVVADADYSGGDFMDFGARVGAVSTDVLSGESVALQIEGVFKVVGKTADTITLGAKLYLAGVEASTTVAGQIIGYATTTKAGSVAGSILVKLGD